MDKGSVKKVRSARRRGAIDRAPSTANQPARRSTNKKKSAAPKLTLPKLTLGSRLPTLVKTSVIGGAALLVAGALEIGYRLMSTSKTFALTEVAVDGQVRATEAEVLALAGVEQGDNLLSLDVAELEAAVARHPWVKKASVTRRLPHTLKIQVTEHEPVALIALGSLYYVDRQAEVFKRFAASDEDGLPVITGLSREEVEGKEHGPLKTAVDALADLAPALGDSDRIEELHVEPDAGISVRLAKQDLYLRLGAPPFDLSRLKAVSETLAARGIRAKEITLGGERRPERVIARLELPPPSAKDSKRGGNAGKGL